MPDFDRKGPEGQGSQTGRGVGKCNPRDKNPNEQAVSEDYSKGRGRRLFRGLGLGRGKGVGRGQGRRLGNR